MSQKEQAVAENLHIGENLTNDEAGNTEHQIISMTELFKAKALHAYEVILSA